MLFTGSENYPEQHHIEKIVNKYQGEQNGVTKAFTTSYFYKINSDGLEEFLPALADAVENPTFSEENILKEVNNVNSEISMRMTYNKNLAYYKLLKAVGNPNSHIFSDGFANIDTSNINVAELRKKIIDFHKAYYSANLMTLAVITDEDFKTVRRKIEHSFSRITDRNVERPFFNATANYEVPLKPTVIGQVFYLKAFTAPAKFTMIFQLGSDRRDPHFQPIEFFSVFLNYFAEHSLKQTLITEGLITSFDDTIAYEDYVSSLYAVSFKLTDAGRKNISKVVKHFFRFVRFIRELPNKEAIFESLAKTSKYAFLFNIRSKFIDFSNIKMDLFERALKFSENLQDYPPEMIFTASNVLFKFNQTTFDEVLAMINPLNALFMIEDPEFQEETKEEKAQDRRTRLVATEKDQNRRIGGVRTKRTRKLSLEPSETFVSVSDPGFESSLLGTEIEASEPNHKAARILADQTIFAQKTETTASKSSSYEAFFDNAHQNVKLDRNFDFDNNRAFTVKVVNQEALTHLSSEIDSLTTTYDTNTVFDTAHLDYYEVVSTCEVPETLKRGYTHDHSAEQNSVTIAEQTSSERNIAHTKNVFAAIFNDAEKPLSVQDQFTYLRDLLSYKLCLVKEFNDDDKKDTASRAHKESRLSVYHSLYRKTLQPKCVISVVIEPEGILEAMTHTKYESKLQQLLRLDILCSYLSRHFELRLNDEYIKGNDFGCRVDNFRMILTFEGISSQIENFVMVVLGNFLKMTAAHAYDRTISENIKQRVIDGYSQFKSITSIKLSMYYLSLIMDKMSVDYSSDDKLEFIKTEVRTITEEQLALTMSDVLESNNIVVLGVGNVEEKRIVDLGQRARSMLRLSNKAMNADFNVLKYRSYMQQNFITNIEFNEHLLVRLENQDKKESNSAYVTYFKIHRTNRPNKLQALVLDHFLRKVIYDELRNKMNLGYVAQSGVRSYYHVS